MHNDTPKDPTSIDSELERAAEGLESKDFRFASRCLTHLLERTLPPEPETDGDPAQRAVSTSARAALQKAINALDQKDFALVGICVRKAHQQLEPTLPAALAQALKEFGRAIGNEDFSGAARQLRQIRPETPPLIPSIHLEESET